MRLSEGWDVKNVFQIVPHEERAFDSKLLIAQVLGRGLRRPEGWLGEDPIVTVFNHDAWSGRIKHLVNEILEVERRLTSSVLRESPYHFSLHHLDYTRNPESSEHQKKGEYRFLEQGYVDIPSQVEAQDVTVEFERAVSGEHVKFTSKVQYKTFSIEEVSERMFRALEAIDTESATEEDPKDRTNYAKKFPPAKCEAIVRESLNRAGIKGDRITDDNRQKFLQALGPLRRKSAKRVVYKLSPTALVVKNTAERQAESCSAAELRRGSKTVFFLPESEATLVDEQQEFFREVADEDGDFSAGRALVPNSADFKTPTNIVIAEPAVENVKKHEFARQHFEQLNTWLKRDGIATRYQFNMVTPRDFTMFFTKLREGELVGFRSQLDVAVMKAGKTE